MHNQLLNEIRNLGIKKSELWIKEAEFGYRHIEPLIKKLPEGAKILEVGCGSGILLSCLSENFKKKKFTGLEPFGKGFSSLIELNKIIRSTGVQVENIAYEDTSYLINGGIHSNDALKNYKKTNQYILVITNFLGHAPVCPFEIKFDKQLFNQMKLLELQKKYNKKIIIKTKSRITQSHHYTKDHDYLESILPKDLNYEIITDFIDNNRLICDSFLVIGPTSTFCFKPIQKGIPTILINKAGITGNFYNYRSLIDINDNFLENVEKEINAGRDTEYINSILEGGSEYKSTEIYINSLKNLLRI